MKILVTGGAGYIGSHTVLELQKEKHQVVVFDNLVYGHKQAVNCPLIKGDLLDKNKIKSVFKKEKPQAVIHFANYASSGVSMKEPAKYFENNIMGGLNLLEAMIKAGTKYLVYSSSCAVYGYPKKLPVKETAEKNPVSVYGETKLMFERILNWYDELFDIKNISLRYFNAAGASLNGKIGEDHRPETHIIPIAMEVALGKRKEFQLFGDDYSTPDGSCIRDYIHVLDLAAAHIKALKYLQKKNESDVFNIGTGRGYSNKEILRMIKKVSGVDFPVKIGLRRPGDPAVVYADNQKAKKVLGWQPKYSDLKTIIESAWQWYKNHPNGYKGA
ncbi:MAG TPA: UDP-glucose 4-epimerase GalE [Nevskiaceae bacterium]|nr:UDP-glucose 4-epimerase GalE [Nevskiaceae bacterium]